MVVVRFRHMSCPYSNSRGVIFHSLSTNARSHYKYFSTFRTVTSFQEVMTYVHYGLRRRHEDATKVHAHSSRSHLIVQLNLYHTKQSSQVRVTSPEGLGPPPSPPPTPTSTQTRRLLPQVSVDGPRRRSK